MVNILLVCPMEDNQSGKYLHDSFIEDGHRVAYFDWKRVLINEGTDGLYNLFKKAIIELKPDLTLIVKGLGFTADLIKEIRTIHPHYIAGWIFDVTLGGTYVKDVPEYVKMIKELDIFYTIDNSAVSELKELGVNAKWLTEGCHPSMHNTQIFNSIQAKKYGADIVFLGSIGSIHPNREKLLKRIADEGFYMKIYGTVEYPNGKDPDWVKDTHTGYMAVNEHHSLIVNASKIVIGIDGWPHRNKSYSARLYRTLCAGGFLLTTHTDGIDEYFKIGKHLDTFKTEDELIEKIIKYLQNDELRDEIAKAGKQEVLKNHTFLHRIKNIMEDFNTFAKK